MVIVTELRLGVELQYDRGTEVYRQAIDDLDRLLARFEVYHIFRPIATAAAEIIADLRANRNRLDDVHDVYIGATARAQQLPVLTANVDHFERIEDVPVIDRADF
jgi:tRNA(fMet)-specific endonuclease VapC